MPAKNMRARRIAGPPGRQLGWFCALSALLCLAARAQAPSEYEVKAAFLFNFAKFVEWPTGTFSSANAPFRICVLGKDPFGNTLDRIVADKTLDEHRIEIDRSITLADANNCQILFLASSEARRMAQIVQQLKGGGVLTVADTSGFAQMGGIINFVLDEDRVRFEINLRAAEAAHLKLSARLVTVAERVVGDDPAGMSPHPP